MVQLHVFSFGLRKCHLQQHLLPQPVSQIRVTAVGFQPTLNATVSHYDKTVDWCGRLILNASFFFQSQYFSIQEATIYAWVAPDYHVTSLHAISVEGETGMNLDSQQAVDIGTSSDTFPDFDGRGYAVLQLDSTMQVSEDCYLAFQE